MRNKKLFMAVLLVTAISFMGCGNTQTVNNSTTEAIETTTDQNNIQEESTTVESATEENTTEECTTEETATEVLTTEEPTTEEITTEEPTTEEPTTEEPTTEGPTTEESTTEEPTTEEPATEESSEEQRMMVEYTCDENNIPTKMIENVKSCTEYKMGAYLYGDIDQDNEKELLAAYYDESVGRWKIMRLENETAEPEEFYATSPSVAFDNCELGLIGLKNKIHYVINLYRSNVLALGGSLMGPGTGSIIVEETETGVKEVLDFGNIYWQAENGDVVLKGGLHYGAYVYKPTYELKGLVRNYSYLTYDEENEQYKEYVANEITEEEFLTYEGATDCLEEIRNSYADYEVRYTFFKRNNGIMHVQCEYENEEYIFFDNYTVYYEDNVITNVSEKNEGTISRKCTNLDEA